MSGIGAKALSLLNLSPLAQTSGNEHFRSLPPLISGEQAQTENYGALVR